MNVSLPTTLILTEKDIKRLVTVKDAIKAVENVFREHGTGRTQMPSKLYLTLEKYHGDFRAMPAYLDRSNIASLKWINVHPLNKKAGFPSIMAVIILSDPKNGFPLCIASGAYATALRTGAAGAVAAKYLARKNSKTLGLVGAGVQARTQLNAILEVFRIKEVKVWGMYPGEAAKFIKNTKTRGLKLFKADTVKDCVKDSDIVITTTPSRKPIVKFEWLKKGCHINAIGADAKGKEELEPLILKNAKVVVDSWEQASHSGEINVPVSKHIISMKNIYADIGQIVCGRKRGRTSDKDVTVFDSTGLAIQDTAIANFVYQAALKNHAGKKIFLVT